MVAFELSSNLSEPIRINIFQVRLSIRFKRTSERSLAHVLALVTHSKLFLMVFIPAMAIWLWSPLYEFVIEPPLWLTAQKLIMVSVAGLCVGLGAVLMSYKLPSLQAIFQYRWVAILSVWIVQRVILFF